MTVKTDKSNFMSIEEVAKVHLLSKASVNYYTNLGILHVAAKDGNKRLYDKEETRQRLEKVKEMRAAGYSLRLIARHFSAPKENSDSVIVG